MRRSSTQIPFDIPVVWDTDGHPSELPVDGTFQNSYVLGFRLDGTPLGLVRRPNEFPGPAGYWTPGGFAPLPHPADGGAAQAGNGQYIGGATYELINARYVGSATLWDTSGYHLVAGLEGTDSKIDSMNALGAYVGVTIDFSNPNDFNFGGFIGRGGSATRLNFPGFTETRAFEINDDGWFTGVWEPAFATQRGYLARHDLDTSEQEIYDLGIFPGYGETWAYAINNDKTLVGGAQLLGGDFDKALIWLNGSLAPQDLNLFVDIPGATLIDAYRINNAGQILAEARLDAGGFAYYRLDPIPEPASAGLVVGVLYAHRRRRISLRPALALG